MLLNFFIFFFSSSTDSCNMKWLASSQNCLDGGSSLFNQQVLGKRKKKISALIKSRCAEHSVKERFVPETPVWNLKAGGGSRCDRFLIKSYKIMIKCCYLRKCHERTLNLECLPPWAMLLFRNTFLILIHFIKSIFYIIISPTLLLYSLYDILCAFIRFIVITIIAMNIKQLD